MPPTLVRGARRAGSSPGGPGLEHLGLLLEQTRQEAQPLVGARRLEHPLRVGGPDGCERADLERRASSRRRPARPSPAPPGSPSSARSARVRRSSRSAVGSDVVRIRAPARARAGRRPRPAGTASSGSQRATEIRRRPTATSAHRPSGSSAASTMWARVPIAKRASPPPTSLPRSMSVTPNSRSPSSARRVSSR